MSNDIRRKVMDLKNQRAAIITDAEKALEAKNMEEYAAKMEDVAKFNADIEAHEKLIAEAGKFDKGESTLENLHDVLKEQKEDEIVKDKLDAARSGNEYARAFANAIVNGIGRKKGQRVDALSPLYNALTIGGGTPAGSDGGFLVPIDFDNMIHRVMKEFIRLADFFNVETVSGFSGWRAIENGKATTPLPLVDEAVEITPTDQPKFRKVEYAVKKYGDIVIVSDELSEDNTAGLMQYLAEWFGPKVVLTENALLLALLNSLTATAITGTVVAGLKTALNKGLNTAHKKLATIITNQDGYDLMDQQVDTNGRGMLVPDPTQPDVYRFKNRPVVPADNDLLPNISAAAPVYIGAFAAFGTLFRRKAFEFASTDVGGNAWRTDTTEVRGITRLDAQIMDDKAAVLRTIAVS